MFIIKFGKILVNISSNFFILYSLPFWDANYTGIRIFDIMALFGIIWFWGSSQLSFFLYFTLSDLFCIISIYLSLNQ